MEISDQPSLGSVIGQESSAADDSEGVSSSMQKSLMQGVNE